MTERQVYISGSMVAESEGRIDPQCRTVRLLDCAQYFAGPIHPATRFNDLVVGDGLVGPVTRQLLSAWSQLVGVDVVAQAQNQLGQ